MVGFLMIVILHKNNNSMKHAVMKLIVWLLIAVPFIACNRNKGTRQETITGKPNEIVIVIGKEIWKGEIGTLLRDMLTQPLPTLAENEPFFSLIDVPPDAFINILKSHRNIITVKISSTFTEDKVEFTNNTWAYPQAIINIQAASVHNFKNLFTVNNEKIIAYFLKAEKDRLQKTYRNDYEKSVYNTLEKELGFRLYVPAGFKITKKDSTFAWIRYESPLVTQNILVYTYAYPPDSTFNFEYLLKKRNTLTGKNIPGPAKGSYMTTEMHLPKCCNRLTYHGNLAYEMRGWWKIENVFMGGPFVSLTVLSPDKKKVVTVEGNVYAPNHNKREYIRQLEAMIYSLEFSQLPAKNNNNFNK